MVAYHYNEITQKESIVGYLKKKKFEWMQNKQNCRKSYGNKFEWKYQDEPKIILTLKYFLALFTKKKKKS